MFNLFSQPFAISSDHGGYDLKTHLIGYMKNKGITNFKELGASSTDRVHYPIFVEEMVQLILNKEIAWGIMICGTGMGTAIAANRYQGIHSALCSDVTIARLARSHNDANILNLGGRVTGNILAEDILEAFASTSFLGDRYQTRKEMIDKMGNCG